MADEEKLSPDDLLYLQETLVEVRSLQTSANTLSNFCSARLTKKYDLINGCSMDEKTGVITRPKPQKVDEEDKSSSDNTVQKS